MHKLRHYQAEQKGKIFDAWHRGAKVALAQCPTGGGKTVIAESCALDLSGHGCAIAHRTELVGQLSMAWTSAGIEHDIIAPKASRNMIVRKHMKKFKRTLYNPNARWSIGSVDTIKVRKDADDWFDRIENFIIDEGHHVLRDNKWGKVVERMRNAKRGLLLTATPGRPDGKGLGSWSDGIVDALIEGPEMRWLIENGFLCDYDLHAVRPKDLNLKDVAISDVTGDFVPGQLAEAVKKSKTIIGDIVGTYLEFAKGKRGLTFAVDVEHGQRIADAFIASGVPALMIHGGTPDAEREGALEKFDAGEVLQLVSCDIFGEGTDLPNVECISFGRPTESFIVYAQQFGRVLRLLLSGFQMDIWDTLSVMQRLRLIAASEKPKALVFDHVSNIWRHEGPPDKPRSWQVGMDGKSKRRMGPNDDIPARACLGCFKKYERFYTACPYCGVLAPEPSERGGAAEVDGNVYLLSEEILAQLRAGVTKINGDAVIPYGRPDLAHAARTMHAERQKQHALLRQVMDLWAGSYPGVSNEVNAKRFYFLFNTDIMSALSLGAGDAKKLRERITDQMATRGILTRIGQ